MQLYVSGKIQLTWIAKSRFLLLDLAIQLKRDWLLIDFREFFPYSING
jgi:hypothetical protein